MNQKSRPQDDSFDNSSFGISTALIVSPDCISVKGFSKGQEIT